MCFILGVGSIGDVRKDVNGDYEERPREYTHTHIGVHEDGGVSGKREFERHPWMIQSNGTLFTYIMKKTVKTVLKKIIRKPQARKG